MRSAEVMEQADMELRETILKVSSLTGKSKIDLLVPCTPSVGRGRLTVEIWRVAHSGQLETDKVWVETCTR